MLLNTYILWLAAFWEGSVLGGSKNISTLGSHRFGLQSSKSRGSDPRAIAYLSLSLSIYIYIYIYNPHLGLIHAPPLICFCSSKQPFSLSIYYQKARHTQNHGQDLINPAGDTSCSSWGSSWGSSIFSQNETPQKVISCTYKELIKRNTFWAPETRGALLGTPKITPKMTPSCICCLCWLIFPGICCFTFIYFRGPGTLLIGGVY